MVLFLFAYRMTEKKKEAEAAIDLMTVQYERICNDEEKRKGLIIVQAKYGKFESDTPQGQLKASIFRLCSLHMQN